MALSTPSDSGDSRLPALPELGCGATLTVHYGNHTYLGPNCSLTEAPDCARPPAPYRVPERPAHSDRTESHHLEVHPLDRVGVLVVGAIGLVLLGVGLAKLLF